MKRFRLEDAAIGTLALVGIILRLRQYLTGRSLWVDEAMLALNIVNRNFAGLLQPLDYNQGAPVGFLFIEKIFNLLFGRNEYALRLFPLIVGLLSLWAFYLLIKRFTRGTSLILAFMLFALNPRLIHYSSEAKQYIADVFITIGLLLLATQYFEKPSRKRLGMLALAGFLALWSSHPALFILAGIGTTLFISNLQKRDTATLRLVTGMGIFWLANIGLLYTLTLGDLQRNSYMIAYWQDAFAPMPPWSNREWYWSSYTANVNSHLNIAFAPLLLFLSMLAGWAVLFKQQRDSAVLVAWTVFFTLLASSLALYPSLERMVLFLAPVGILLIGASLEYMRQMLRGRPVISAVVTVLAGIYLLQGALPLAIEQFVSPKYFEHIRPAMEILQASWRDGDAMYISNGGIPAFEYYAPMYGLEDADYVTGGGDYENPNSMLQRLETLKGQSRVWVLLSHVYEKKGFNEQEFLLEYLKENGTRRRVFIEAGTSVYLYLYDLDR